MSRIHADGAWDRYLDAKTEREERGETVLYGMDGEEFVITKITEPNGEPGAMESIRLSMDEARRFADFLNRWFL